MPRKVFTAGEVLAAADVNDFLMDQTVMVFAGTAARGSAIGTATEGMYAHLNDTDSLTYYDGSTWVNRIPTSTSAILQVVSVTKTDVFTSTSPSYEDITGLSATITPSSTSSKILVLSKIAMNINTAVIADLQLLRGATVIGGGTAVGNRSSGMSAFYTGVALATTDLSQNFLDSPASVSSQTYKIQCRVQSGALRINTSTDDGNVAAIARTSSTITLMEVAG
jgi:hypothetical protein